MPELPEVEVTRRGLRPHLVGSTIQDVRWSNKRLRAPMPRKFLDLYIRGGRVAAIDRRAKYLLLRMTSQGVLLVHLGMTGNLGLFPAATPRARHDHLCLLLDNGLELRFNDARRFGAIYVWPPLQAAALENEFSARLGPEPFSDEFNAGRLWRRAQGKKQAVKNFLMDSRMVAGIGNIYASEILFAAGIHPQTPVGMLKKAAWRNVAASCRAVLSRAIEAGGSTISDFLGADGEPGYFQLQFQVYNRAGAGCKQCGQEVKKTVLGGRATYFCPVCQPLNKRRNGSR